MNLPDLANGSFETMGGAMQMLNCWRLYKDKGYAGVSVGAFVMFTSWGFFNLYYYPHLDQWLSFSGGCIIVAANTVWVGLAAYYGRKK